jgi:RNA methyltransferase, TrmH family
LNSETKVRHIYATGQWLENNKGIQAPLTEISDIELGRISNLQTPHEVLLIAEQKAVSDEPIIDKQLTLVLDGIQDPGNMGTIIRTADWFGLQQVICSPDCVEIYNPKVVQSSMGSIARVNCSEKDLNNWEPHVHIPVFGALLEGRNIFTVGKVDIGLLVIGNESKGIRDPFLSKINHPVTIPKSGNAESLNAAVATGIILGCMINGQ